LLAQDFAVTALGGKTSRLSDSIVEMKETLPHPVKEGGHGGSLREVPQ